MPVQRPSVWARLTLRPPQVGTNDADQLIAFECAPLSCTVTWNDHYSADTWQLAFSLKDFPFDPRLIRGVTVEIFLADLFPATSQKEAADYWRGLSRDEMVTHCLIAGAADEAENEWAEEGFLLHLRGRDYTAYFLDVQLSQGIHWAKRTVVEQIAELIRKNYTTNQLSIEIRAGEERLPGPVAAQGASATPGDELSALARQSLGGLLAPTDTSVVLDVTSGVPFAKQAVHANSAIRKILAIKTEDFKPRATHPALGQRMRREGETVWSALQEIALQAGLILYVELDRVVLREPHTLTADHALPDEPYRFTIGRNVQRYSPRRLLGRQTNVNVQVTSFDPVKGRTLVARSPTDVKFEADNPGSASAIGDATGKIGKTLKGRTVTPYVVRGVNQQIALQRIADALAEAQHHFDLEVGVETTDLFDSDGRPLWGMRYAVPVIVDFAAEVDTPMVLPVEQQLRRLQELGFDAGDLDRLVGAGDGLGGFLAQLNLPFVLAEGELSYTGGDGQGFSAKLKLQGRKQVSVELAPGVTVAKLPRGSG